MKKSGRILALILAGALTGALAGCSSTQKEGEKKLQTINVSEVTHSVFYAPQYVAINKGFFEKRGLKLELTDGQGADKVMAAVLSGSMDIGFAGPESTIYVYNEGRQDYPKVFAQLTQRDGSFLVGREKDDSFTWDKLRDKVVLPGRKGGVPYMALEYVIKQNGLVPGETVTLDDSIQFALMAGAFTAGTGDYVTIFEPTATEMEKQGKGYIVASVGEEAGEIPYTAYFTSQSYMQEHPDVVQSFTDAIYEGQQWVSTHTAKEIAEVIHPSFSDTDLDVLETVVQRYLDIGAWSETPVMKEESFQRLQTVMESAGELNQKADFDKIVDNSFAQKAVESAK
ncbi:MAG: ABC transporter substrate-binding protein [Oscillospiraceae bacterium]